VDNASTDGTGETAISEWQKHGREDVHFTVLQQPLAGKNHAYRLAAAKAKYEYLLTCDDDNRLGQGYISGVYSRMEADKRIGVLGGCGVLDAEQPVWPGISEHERSYVNGPQTWAATAHWVYGAGSTCRKSVLGQFYEEGWKPMTSGRSGDKLICGEDVEICFMFFLAGYQICAAESLKFNHFVPLKRQNLQYLLKLQYWISYSDVLLNSYLMLLEADRRPVTEKLAKWFYFNLKNYVSLACRREPAGSVQRLQLRAHLGTMHAIITNGRRLVRHYEELSVLVRQLANKHP
jgi:glycosyltransferase involved in cell wall biosynthesis